MAIQLFGFSITRSKDAKLENLQEPNKKTFALPQNDDGAVTIQSGAYYGHYVDLDGVVRRLPMLARIVDVLYPSIVLEALRVAAGDPSYQIKSSDAGIEFVRIPQFPPIATDEHGRIWLSWNTKFKRIDATEIEPAKLAEVKDKIVVLGLTIEGVGGIIATPIGEKWAHEIQAQALQTVIDGTTITRLSYANIVELLLLVPSICQTVTQKHG